LLSSSVPAFRAAEVISILPTARCPPETFEKEGLRADESIDAPALSLVFHFCGSAAGISSETPVRGKKAGAASSETRLTLQNVPFNIPVPSLRWRLKLRLGRNIFPESSVENSSLNSRPGGPSSVED